MTDKRIIRYFMTIPEASQLVLTSGAMAQSGGAVRPGYGQAGENPGSGGEPDAASAALEPYKDIEIEETGLRPGEKLYEELLIKTETLTKTDNDMIFVERDDPLSTETIEKKLEVLQNRFADRGR